MILDIFFTVGFAIINFFLYPITSQADVALDNGFVVAMANLLHFVAILNDFGRFTVIFFFAISVVLIVELAIFGYKGIMWVLRKIPFLNLK